MKKRREKNKIWENLQGFRYAHRGLFHQPLSASRKLSASVAKNPLRRQTDTAENLKRRQEAMWKEDIAR